MHIHAHRDASGHWSAHAENHPGTSFGGDTAETAALRLMAANPEVGQHIVERRVRDDGIEFLVV